MVFTPPAFLSRPNAGLASPAASFSRPCNSHSARSTSRSLASWDLRASATALSIRFLCFFNCSAIAFSRASPSLALRWSSSNSSDARASRAAVTTFSTAAVSISFLIS